MSFFAFIIAAVGMSPLILWLAVIRPYCLKHGQGYTTGASFDVVFWIDWQQASEIAAENSHKGMIFWCRLFLVINLIFTFGMFLGMIAGLARS